MANALRFKVSKCGISSTAVLVVRAQAGDLSAFGELVRAYRPSVYAKALTYLRNPAEAEDLAQDVFLHSMARLWQLRDPRCFPGWLHQIAKYKALNRLTRRPSTSDVDQETPTEWPDTNEGPLDEAIRAEEATRLRRCLYGLRPLDRDVLEGFYLHGHSVRRLSQELAVPVGTVKRRLHDARQRLRKALE